MPANGAEPLPPAADPPAPAPIPEVSPRDLRLPEDVLIRLRRGQHPDPAREPVLARHFSLPPTSVAGPLLVRILCTDALILTACGLAWLAVWIPGTIAGTTEFLRVASILMANFTVIMLVFGAFMPLPWFDEAKVAAECEQRRRRL